MGGIVFFRSLHLKEIEKFYIERLGMQLWLRQQDCTILKHGNLMLGFCQRDGADVDAMITFVLNTKADIDEVYLRLTDIAEEEPKENAKYEIYQFFGKDPEGRILEFQVFLNQSNLR
ncbi:MAG: VOC family protein [Candidatus Thorarchaeota archaeon]